MKIEQTELPPDWVWTTMEEIADVVGGGTPKTNDPTNYESGTIPWITPADLSGYTAKHIAHGARFITQKGLNDSSAKMMPAGTVLFTSRAPIGYVAIASNPVCTNQGFKSFVLKEGILPDYVYWWLKGSKDLAESMASGTTFLELSGAKAKQIPIPIAPLDQQQRIVAEIEKQFSRLDEAVANLKRVKANLKRYKAAVLKAAVEGRLVETEAELVRREGRSFETGAQLLQRILETRRSQWKGKGKYKEPAAPDTTDLSKLPEGWVWVTVQQLAVVQLGKMLDRQKHRSGKELPYLRNINVRWDLVDSLDLLTMFFKDGELDRYGLQNGDVLVCEGGEPGRAAVWDGRLPGMMYQKAIHRVRFFCGYKQRLLVFFLEFLAKTGRLERWFTGSTIKHFTRESFLQLPVPLAPENEQVRIVTEVDRRLSLIQRTESQVDANFQRAERLRQAFLGKAFSGSLVQHEDTGAPIAANQRRA